MKKILATTLFAIACLCSLSAQKPLPIQTALIDSTVYVVEFIPMGVAQKNIAAQLVQVNKQIETVEKQMADLLKKRDDLMKQKSVLEFAQKQLDEAAKTEAATKAMTAPAPPPPAPEKKTAKPKKPKN